MRPASRHSRATEAPMTTTFLPPAAARARSTAARMSPSTNVMPGSPGAAGGLCVSTNCGPSHAPPNGSCASAGASALWPTS